jgi:hypothetical protein
MLNERRQGAISVLLLCLFLATAYSAKAQSQPRPIGPRPGQTIRRFSNLFVNAPVVVRDSKGEPVLDLTQSNFRAYDNGAGQMMDTFGIGNASLSAAMQVVPPSATLPPTFGLSPIPGMPQTPTTEALRAGNIDVGALVVWVVKHANASGR